MPTKESIYKAAQIWCRPECSHIEMEPVLGSAFAKVLDEELARLRADHKTALERVEGLQRQVANLDVENERLKEGLEKIAYLAGACAERDQIREVAIAALEGGDDG